MQFVLMNISGLSSTNNYFSQLTSATARSVGSSTQRAAPSNPLANSLNSLASALESGDTETANSVFSDILAHAPKAHTDQSSSDSDPGAKIGEFLASLQSALASGDTASAESAVASLKDFLAANPPPEPPGGAGGAEGRANPLAKALDAIEQALNSGDTATAQSTLADLLAHAPKQHESNSDTSAVIGDNVSEFLKSLQIALSSNDTLSAQSLTASLQDYLAAHPPQPPGLSTYSTDGTLASSSVSSFSVLA